MPQSLAILQPETEWSTEPALLTYANATAELLPLVLPATTTTKKTARLAMLTEPMKTKSADLHQLPLVELQAVLTDGTWTVTSAPLMNVLATTENQCHTAIPTMLKFAWLATLSSATISKMDSVPKTNVAVTTVPQQLALIVKTTEELDVQLAQPVSS